PESLATVCERALEKTPHWRYADAEGMRNDLARVLEGCPIRRRALVIPRRLVRSIRFHRARIMVVALFTAILSIAGVASTLGLREARARAETRWEHAFRAGEEQLEAEIISFGAPVEDRAARLTRATQQYQACVEVYPKRPDARLRMVEVRLRQGDLKGATGL